MGIFAVLWKVTGRLLFIVFYPFIAYALNRNERARVIIFHENETLLVRSWVGSSEWDLPGGGLHKSEDPRSGAARELYEELKLNAIPDSLELVDETKVKSGLINYTAHFLKLNLEERPHLRLQRLEVTEAAWFNKQEISNIKINPTIKKQLAKAWA
jgi:8-oxo-dGTP pyrophosphatase MutT (NUDIX family)